MFGGFGAEVEASATKSSSSVDLERTIEAALEADRGGPLGAHALAAERAGDMPGKDLDAVRELEQPAKRVKEAFGAFLRADRQIRPSCVADEERVAGEHEPGLVGTGAIDDGEARVLRPVPGRVDRAEHDLAELQLHAVLERVVRIRGLCGPVDRHRDAVLQREPAVARTGDRRACASRSSGRSSRRAWRPPSSTGSIAYGGSTIAATPASSSPTRYDAQPRSSSRNCWNSTRHDAITPSGGGRGAARRTRVPARAACRRRRPSQGSDDASGPGTTVRLPSPRRPRRRYRRPAGQRHLARRARSRACGRSRPSRSPFPAGGCENTSIPGPSTSIRCGAGTGPKLR